MGPKCDAYNCSFLVQSMKENCTQKKLGKIQYLIIFGHI